MSYIEQFEQELLGKLNGAEDTDSVVRWVSEKVLESYRNGITAGQKGAAVIRKGESRRRGSFGKAEYTVKCESRCPGLPRDGKRGDFKKIDFKVKGRGQRFVIEVKWAKKARLNVKQDFVKLNAFHDATPKSRSFLCVFGRKSHIQNVHLVNGSFTEHGVAVYAEFGTTRYGCRIYEISVVS